LLSLVITDYCFSLTYYFDIARLLAIAAEGIDTLFSDAFSLSAKAFRKKVAAAVIAE